MFCPITGLLLCPRSKVLLAPLAPHRNLCSKKDDTLPYEKSYKIIVGSATEMNQRLSYLTVDGFPGANSKSYYDRGIDCHRLVGLLRYLQSEGRN